MSRIAVYPGSFDPLHLGHVDIITRLSPIFDEVIVLVAHSSLKESLFTVEERSELIRASLGHLSKIKVDSYEGLTVDYMRKKKAQVMIRGLRAVVDFEYEMTMSSMNQKLAPEIETMLVFARPESYYISSRGVKELARHGGSLKDLVPDPVKLALNKKFGSVQRGV